MTGIEQNINIAIGSLNLPGILILPKSTRGLVIFAHGSGSSRFSSRNVFVSKVIQETGVGTLLFDLLTEKEDEVYEKRFDIALIAGRLVKTVKWLLEKDDTKNLTMGFFGASTGAAAALKAAAILPEKIKAVVSRGGRPDLAMEDLAKVKAPTLLIVGGADDAVIELNKKAYSRLDCVKQLAIVPGATHLFEEPGTLEEAAKLASEWFVKYFSLATI